MKKSDYRRLCLETTNLSLDEILFWEYAPASSTPTIFATGLLARYHGAFGNPVARITLSRIRSHGYAIMKFLDIFSKQAPDSIKNVRSIGAPTVAERQATSRKIDAIESEISAELDRHDGASIDSSLAGHVKQYIAEASILYATTSRNPPAHCCYMH